MKTKDILYSAGRCFAQNNENWVGFFNKTAKQYKPLVRKHSEELKRDKHGRVLIGTTDDAAAQHLLNIETVHTHWANAQTNTGVYIASHPGNIPFWRAKAGHTSHGRETLEKVPRNKFWKNTISLMQETLRQKLSLQSEQPHPAILQWIAARFDLEQQCDTTAFNCTYGIFPATPRLTASMTLPTSIDMDMVGVLPAVELKGTYAQSSFVSVRTSSKDWKQRLEQLKRSCTKNKSLNFVCMLTLDGRDREFACQKMANATGGVVFLHCPQSSLNVVEACGFKENVDPTHRVRRSEDYRQPGHKAEGRRQKKSSYELRDNHTIVGPTHGSAAVAEKHGYSTSEHEIVFLAYCGSEKGGGGQQLCYTRVLQLTYLTCADNCATRIRRT